MHTSIIHCPLTSRAELRLVLESSHDYSATFTVQFENPSTGEEHTLWPHDSFCVDCPSGSAHPPYSLQLSAAGQLELWYSQPEIQIYNRHSRFVDLDTGRIILEAATISNTSLDEGETDILLCDPTILPTDIDALLILRTPDACHQLTLAHNQQGDIVGVMRDGILAQTLNPPLKLRHDLSPIDQEENFPIFDKVQPSLDGKTASFYITSPSFKSQLVSIEL